MTESRRLASLDILRTAAVVAVIMSHWGPMYPGNKFADTATRSFGAGVDLFFVLSGFLVSGLIFREYQRSQDFDGKRFLTRRGFKIYPAFYIMIIVTVALSGWLGLRVTWSRVLAEAFFVQNYATGVWGHTWSLGVEEHFYILLTIGALVLARKRLLDNSRLIIGGIVAICGAVLLVRIGYALFVEYNRGDGWGRVYSPTHMRLDALLIGTLLSYLYYFHHVKLITFVHNHRTMLLLVGCVLVAPRLVLNNRVPFMQSFGLTMLAVGFAAILISLVTSARFDRLTEWAPMRGLAWLGQYSYSTYLWHVMVMWIIVEKVQPTFSMWGVLSIELALSFALGVATAKIIELPMLAVRERLYPSQAPVPSVTPV